MFKKATYFFLVMGVFLFAISTFAFAEAVIDLPQTGQAKCYNSYGIEIACAGTGQDGDIQAGDAGPMARFTDNGDGTISDNFTGLMWLKDLNCLQSNYSGIDNDSVSGDGAVTWQHALDFIRGVNTNDYPDCGAGFADWRLPNINELSSLFRFKSTTKSLISFLNEAGFVNASEIRHWSSTNRGTWAFLYYSSDQSYSITGGYNFVVPIRTFDVSRLPKTGQIECYDSTGNLINCSGTGQDGELQSGVAWPSPRFVDNNDGTVTDNLTGLMWLKDANCINTKYMEFDDDCGPGGAVSWQHALDFILGMNNDTYLNCSAGYNDWRLPNVNEITSLLSYSNNYFQTNHPFINIRNPYGHWTATTNAIQTDVAYFMKYANPSLISSYRKDQICAGMVSVHDVWPVRSGLYKHPDISITPISKNFDGVPVNLSSTQPFTIRNIGTNNLYVDAIAISGADIDQFSLQNDNCSNKKISPVGTCTMDVIFTPTTTGAKNAILNIPSNDPDSPMLTASLSGTGIQYELSISKTGTGAGTVTSSPAGINCGADCSELYNSGTIVTLIATSDQSSLFNGWSSGTGSATSCLGLGNCSFSINADTTLLATFALKTFTVSLLAGTDGSISPNASQTVNYGSTAIFTVTPNTGFHIEAVTGCGGTLSGNTYVTGQITGDCTVTANFAINTYAVTPVAGANGSLSPATAQTVNYESVASFALAPNIGYHIESVSGCGGTLSGSTFTTGPITADCTVTASFAINTYGVTPSAGANGSMTPAAAQTVNYNTTLQFTITPATGYHIDTVSGCNGTLSGNTFTTGPITSDCSVTASFAINTYTVTPSSGANGSITPTVPQTVNYNSTPSFTITPAIGYHIATVSGCGGTISGHTFATGPITADCTVTALFAINTYTVTPSAGANGSMTPAAAQTVNHGSTTSFVVTPNTGYHIDSVSGCNGSLSGDTFTTWPITGDCAVIATFAINTYVVTPLAGSNGTITPNTARIVNHGSTASFTVTPSNGYHIDSVSGCGGLLTGNTYTTGAVTGDCTVSATFAINTYTVTPSVGANGAISPAIPQTVNYNGTTAFTITPSNGYHINTVSGCGGTLSGNTFTTGPITADCTVTALFAINTYTVTPSAGANGSINPNTVQIVNHGLTVSFTVTPSTGYHIATVSGCGGSLSDSTFTTEQITGDCTVTASFAINTYAVTPSAGVNGSINPNTAQIVNHGSTVSFTVTPNTGYHIDSVGGCNGNLSGNTFTTGSITGDCTVTASFSINTYTVTPLAGANGGMIPAVPLIADYNTTPAFTVTPTIGYHIEAVSGCGGSLSGGTFTTGAITADCTITASFAINTYTVTPSAGTNGSISCTPTIVNYGSSSTCAITPETGYHIVDVVVNGNSVGTIASYTIDNITDDATITATFAINSYAITASSGPNGGVICIPATVNHGSSSDCAITPVNGYHVADVLVDGSSVGAITEYSFNGVAADHTITASFEINTYTVKPTAGDGGSISPNSNQTVNHGSTVIFIVTPNIGHHIVSVSGCDGILAGTTYTTGAVTGECMVTATFAINTYVVTAVSGENGSINPDAQIINHGSAASFTVTPITGYHIAYVTGCNGTLSGNIYTTDPIAGDCTVSATFSINTYAVTATAEANGIISCSPTIVNHGSNSECVVTPDTGYHIADVTVNGVSMGSVNSYTIINITGDSQITATFKINTYTIAVTAGPNGTMLCTPNPVNHGSNATCSITPGFGYHTVNAIVDGKTMGAVTTYAFSNVTAAHAIEATFADNHRTAKLKVRIQDRFREHGKGRGIVTSSDGVINCNGKDRHRDDDDDCTYRYYENTVVVLTATAADRSVFAEWYGCDSVDGSTCIVTVDNNTKVEADFDSLDPEISVHTDSLNFGSTKTDRPEKRRVKIKNKGDAALEVSNVKVVGSADFTTNWVGRQTLGYKDSYTFEVIFTPKSKGEKTAKLILTSNDPDEPVVELPISGSGNMKSR